MEKSPGVTLDSDGMKSNFTEISQRTTIEDSENSDRWKRMEESAKIIHGL